MQGVRGSSRNMVREEEAELAEMRGVGNGGLWK